MDEDYISNGISKPDWIRDPETDELLVIEKDAEYREVMGDFYASECLHDVLEPMRVTIADGRTQVMNCCVHCGERVGTAMSQKDRQWVESLAELPASLMDSYNARRYEKKKDMLLALARRQLADRGRFTLAYRDYLASAAWHSKREKVLKRCGGVCEGCGDAKATEVHHLSYQHFMEEFLFELAGLCHDCHERWHGDESASHEVEDEEIEYG